MRFNHFFRGILIFSLFAIPFMFTACTEDNNDGAKGNAKIEITDAPIDNASIQGVFVTVTDIKIDGASYGGFNGKQTINLLAYQNGQTKALGLGELDAKSYSSITLVLDHEVDANGNTPGSYVLLQNGTKQALNAGASATQEVKATGDYVVEEGQQTDVVIDFDVRKALTTNSSGNFQFVSSSNLNASLRAVAKANAGTIKGKINGTAQNTEKIVVYAYEKGTYSSNEASGNIEFQNAVTSSVATSNGNYTLSFLEEGEYELHFVSYKDNDNDGELEANAMIQVTTLLNLNLLGINVDASSETTADVTVTGVLPF